MNEPKLIIEEPKVKVPVIDEIVIDTEVQARPQQPAAPEIPIYELLPEKCEKLKKASRDFDFANPEINPNELASRLVETAKRYRGFGLSAIQVGIDLRVFVAGTENNYVAFFNPVIKDTSEDTVHMAEGCLSFPNLFLHITRPAWVEVEYQDWQGNLQHVVLEGMTARVFQHEFDHLNGIEFIERCKPLALAQGMKRRKKQLDRMGKMMYNIGL